MIALIFSTLCFWRPLDAGSYQKCLKFTQQAYENTHSHWGYFGITNKHACGLHVVTWNRKLNCAYKAFGETLAKRFPMFVLKSNLRSYWGGGVGSVKVLSSSGKLSWVELCLQSIWWNASEALSDVCFEIQFAQLLGGFGLVKVLSSSGKLSWKRTQGLKRCQFIFMFRLFPASCLARNNFHSRLVEIYYFDLPNFAFTASSIDFNDLIIQVSIHPCSNFQNVVPLIYDFAARNPLWDIGILYHH